MKEPTPIFTLRPRKTDLLPLMPVSETLTYAMRRCGHYDRAQTFLVMNPNIREASKRLIEMLTLMWPDINDPDTPLLVNTLKAGFVAQRDSRDDRQFVIAVMDYLMQSLYVTAVYKKKQCEYHHLTDRMSFTEFMSKNNLPSVIEWYDGSYLKSYDTESVKLILASKIFTLNQLHWSGLLKPNPSIDG